MLLTAIRHGETPMNRQKRFNLPTEGLSDAGRTHMKALGEALDWTGFDVLATSPLPRARESLQLMTPPKDIPIIIVDGFHERDFGDWVGRPVEEVIPEDFPMFGLYPDVPGGESLHDMRIRVQTALKNLHQQYTRQHVFLVTHAITMHIIDHIITGFALSDITSRPWIANGDMRTWEIPDRL